MATANVEALHRAYDALNRGDLQALLDLSDPEIVMDLSRNVFNPGVYRGHDGLKRWLDEVHDAWADFRAELSEVLEVGERTFTAIRISGSGRASGARAEMELFQVFSFRDGKALHVIGGFRDRASAMEVASAPELPGPVRTRHL